MVFIQLDIPVNLNKLVGIERIKREHNDKRETIVKILEEYFKNVSKRG